MFSEYASRLLNQSQLRLSRHGQQGAAPLFDGRFDDREDIRESLALRQSRGGRFGAFLPVESDDEDGDEEDYDADHHAMRSSWKPPQRSPPFERDLRHEAIGEESVDRIDVDDAQSDHSAAPDDIMFGVPLDRSIRPPGPQLPESMHDSQGDASPFGAQQEECKIPEVIGEVPVSSVQHDRAFAVLYVLSLAIVSATSSYLWLTTEPPRSILYDSIYGVLARSLPRIGRDVLIALAIATAWFWLLCKCVGPLTYATVIGPPLVGFAFGTYTLTSSFHAAVGLTQITAMRWTSVLMYIAVGLWLVTAWRRRKATGRAVSIISLACTVLDRHPQLVMVTVGLLGAFLLFSTVWLWNFERIFLRGKLVTGAGRTTEWLVTGDSWPLGAFYCLVYLWTYGIMSGVQRSTASAVVSHWYFHRHELPALTPRQVTSAAFGHATSTNFGSSCMSALLVLLTRLPLLVLPRRLSTAVSLLGHVFFAAPIYNLCNPLTLSLAAVHATSLRAAAREADRLHLLDPKGPWQTYRTAKMFLTAARATTAVALGTTAWVASSGSLYGYVVALASATVGWAVVGAVEGCASTVVDATFVCHAIDLRETREGRTHCQEAARAFGTEVNHSLE